MPMMLLPALPWGREMNTTLLHIPPPAHRHSCVGPRRCRAYDRHRDWRSRSRDCYSHGRDSPFSDSSPEDGVCTLSAFIELIQFLHFFVFLHFRRVPYHFFTYTVGHGPPPPHLPRARLPFNGWRLYGSGLVKRGRTPEHGGYHFRNTRAHDHSAQILCPQRIGCRSTEHEYLEGARARPLHAGTSSQCEQGSLPHCVERPLTLTPKKMTGLSRSKNIPGYRRQSDVRPRPRQSRGRGRERSYNSYSRSRSRSSDSSSPSPPRGIFHSLARHAFLSGSHPLSLKHCSLCSLLCNLRMSCA